MPLDERERAELAKKINQQRRSMWKGQVTKDERDGKKREKVEQDLKPQQTHEEVQQISEPPNQMMEEKSVEEIKEVEQPLERVKEGEKEELAEKIKQQRRTVWRGEPAAKSKRKKRELRSTRRVLDYQQEIKPTEQSTANPPNERETKEKSRDYRSKVPTLKLAIIVILSLIGVIAIGVVIGYLAASRDLINI
ncbi:hypothetical protein ACFL6S_35170 [Candidatus Poribacteria bacterium]